MGSPFYCKNCIEIHTSYCVSATLLCNAIFTAKFINTNNQTETSTSLQIIAYYYYYTNTTTNNTTISSLNAVFDFLAVQFFCNFMQFLQSMQF